MKNIDSTDIQRNLYTNILLSDILLSGVNTMSFGFPERLTIEIKSIAPESMKEEAHSYNCYT